MAKRDEIIAEIKRIAEELGRAPSQAEFRKAGKISWHQVYKHFRGMRAAVRAAGLEPGPRGCPADENVMVLDWGRVVRELGRLPSRAEYDERGKHHSVTLHARLGWSQMAHRFVLLVREFHVEAEWKDVVEIVWGKFPLLKRSIQQSAFGIQPTPLKHRGTEEAEERGPVADLLRWPQIRQEQISRESTRANANQGMRLGRVVAVTLAVQILLASWRMQQEINVQAEGFAVDAEGTSAAEAGTISDPTAGMNASSTPMKTTAELVQVRREIYGAPLGIAAMAHAPTNEAGVIFLFGALAAGLGFRVERMQTAFPDCEAKREIVPGKWERVRIEFEFESRNFREHRHDPEGCDVIVCWRHNWAECPERIEVVELERVVAGIAIIE